MRLKLLHLNFLFVTFVSCKTASVPYTQNMKDNLAYMFKVDQQVQTWDEARLEDQQYIDSMNIASEKVFRDNCIVVKEYFRKYSYPGVKENGKETAMHFWTIIQHADHDVEFQTQVLKAMKKQLRKNNVNRRNYAYLYDRVQKNKDKEQLYGTQIDWSSGTAQPYKLKYPEKVNELRKEMELEPIEEYLASFSN